MAKIDSLGFLQHVGDNRHSPLRIIDASLHPYHPRKEEHRKAERGRTPKRRLSKRAAEEYVKKLGERVKNGREF